MRDKKTVIIENQKADDSTYSMPIVISSGNKDRDGDVLVPAGADFSDYLKTGGVLLINHWSDDRSLKNVIGKITDVRVVDNELRAMATWHVGKGNEQADWAYFLAREGQASFSHWFRAKENRDVTEAEKAEGIENVITQWDILEISQVMVPANPDAIALVTKRKYADWKKRYVTKSIKQIGGYMEYLVAIAGALGLTLAPEATEEEIMTAIMDAISAMRGDEAPPADAAAPTASEAPAASMAPSNSMTSVTKQRSKLEEIDIEVKRLESVIQSMQTRAIDNEIEQLIEDGVLNASQKSFAKWLKSNDAKRFEEWKKTLSVISAPKPKSGNRDMHADEVGEAVQELGTVGMSADELKRLFPNAFGGK